MCEVVQVTEFGQRLPWVSWQIVVYHTLLLWIVRLKESIVKKEDEN